MTEPMIAYGELRKPIHTNGKYLLVEAGITNGTYSTQDFIELIKGVSLDGIRTEEGRRDVGMQQQLMEMDAEMGGDEVTITAFEPNREEIELFVNTTFNEMYKRAHGIG